MLDIRNRCVAEYRGAVNLQAIDEATEQAQAVGVLSLDVLVPADEFSTYQEMFERAGFRIAGTVTRGTPESRTFVRFQKSLRNAGDGVVSDGEVVSNGRSREEQAVIDACIARFRRPACQAANDAACDGAP